MHLVQAPVLVVCVRQQLDALVGGGLRLQRPAATRQYKAICRRGRQCRFQAGLCAEEQLKSRESKRSVLDNADTMPMACGAARKRDAHSHTCCRLRPHPVSHKQNMVSGDLCQAVKPWSSETGHIIQMRTHGVRARQSRFGRQSSHQEEVCRIEELRAVDVAASKVLYLCIHAHRTW